MTAPFDCSSYSSADNRNCMFEQAFRNIDDVLRKEAGCSTELHEIATEARETLAGEL